MDSKSARAALEVSKQEKIARVAEAGRLRALAATADTHAKALKDAADKALAESQSLAADAGKAQELADHAGELVAANELLVKAADAERAAADGETQLAVAKAGNAPDAEIQRLQAALDQAKAAAPPKTDVDKAAAVAVTAGEQLQRARDQVQLGQQIADLEARKARAEQIAKDAAATAQKAQAGKDEASAGVTDLAKQLDEAKSKLQKVVAPPAPGGGAGGTAPAGGTSPAGVGGTAPAGVGGTTPAGGTTTAGGATLSLTG